MHDFERLIRAVPDFPQPGILFRDLTPVLEDARAFREVIERLAARYADAKLTKVGGIESRGFILGAPLAFALGTGFTVFRKPGKLPRPTRAERYALEYGESTLHVHEDALRPDDRILLVDDLIATGGTLAAAARLTQSLGATLVEAATVIELRALDGRARLPSGVGLFTLLSY